MKQEISLSPKAIQTINEILSRGKAADITLVGRRLRIVEIDKTLKYDVMIPKE